MDDNIYGGLEFVNTGCSPIWFPSAGLFSQRGVLVSGYAYDASGAFDALPLEQKFAESRKSIERLHPGHGHELEKPMYVGWDKVEWNEGSWLNRLTPQEKAPGISLTHQTGQARNAQAARTETDPAYEQLITPDGPFLFAGDHCSHVVAWQEGAALSSLYAIGKLNDRVKAARLTGSTGATEA